VRLNYLWYSIATLVGSAIWCAVLAWIGVTAGQDAELMRGSVHRISLWVGGLMLFIGALYYFFVHRHMRR
jgi:membrane protein DedA with SNARE-associated domain